MIGSQFVPILNLCHFGNSTEKPRKSETFPHGCRQKGSPQIQAVPANNICSHCSVGTCMPFRIQLSKWNLSWVTAGRWRQAGCFLLLLKAIASWFWVNIFQTSHREQSWLFTCAEPSIITSGSSPQGNFLRSYMTVINVSQITKSCVLDKEFFLLFKLL